MKVRYPLWLWLWLLVVAAGCSNDVLVIETLDDARNASIGVMTGSTGEKNAATRFPEATVLRFDASLDAVAALKAGQLDAVISPLTEAKCVLREHSELKALDEPVNMEQSAIAIRKENDLLLNRVDAILDSLRSTGVLDDMKQRWFGPDVPPYGEVSIAVAESGEPLLIGTVAMHEPFTFVGSKQEIVGFDAELGRRIGLALGRPVLFKDMLFAALLPALSSGKIDMIICDLTVNEERKQSVNFTKPYFDNPQVLLVRNGSPAEAPEGSLISSANDLHGKKIGVFEGTIHDAFVAVTYPSAQILRFSGTADMVLSLTTNKIDVVLMDAITAGVLIRQNAQLKIITDTLLSKPLGYGFQKGDTLLRNRFNRFLAQAKTSGIYDTIYKRWCINDPELAVMPKPKPVSGKTRVTLGVAIDDLPYVSMMNQDYVGFDIELIQTFAQSEGLNMEIVTMNFESLVAALASGKVDMIADGIAITEERQKQVDFSDPYMEFRTAAVVLKSRAGEAVVSEEDSPGGKGFGSKVAESFQNNLIKEKRYLLILDGLQTTLWVSLLSAIFGTLLGALICFLRMSRRSFLRGIASVYIAVMRGTPVLVVLMIVYYVVFASVNISPMLVAVIAFGMNLAAYVSEMFRTGIEGVDKGQSEAGIALGFSKWKTFFHIVMPQAARSVLPVYQGELISMLKMTSVVGYIAVQDLTKAGDIIRSRTFDAFFPLIMVAVIYFLVSWLMMVLFVRLERKVSPIRTN